MKVHRKAPAKINLMLHVVGRLPDGLHHLQSLVAFGSVGDDIDIEKTEQSHITIDGPFADQIPLGADNSIILAAQWLGKKYTTLGQVHIHLTKNLPVSSGMGGGSSDAAATIAALLEYGQISLSNDEQKALILESGALGADVPVCLAHQFGWGPLFWIDGSGRDSLPLLVASKISGTLLLTNSGTTLSTADIFKKTQPPFTAAQDFLNSLEKDFCGNILDYVKAQKNDLMPAAITQDPTIEETLKTLSQTSNCILARMSGSGGTCFALFENEVQAKEALLQHTSQKWTMVCDLLG